MRPNGRATALGMALTLTLAVAGCGLTDRRESGVGFAGPRVWINGRSNEPTGPKVEAASFSSAVGVFRVLTYPSEAGPCYDFVFPDHTVQAGCLRATGIDPTRPVTGRPDTGSTEAIGASALNWGLGHGGPIGMIHHGVAHPDVAEVRLEHPGAEPVVHPVIPAPNVETLFVFSVLVPSEVTDYRLAAYDRQGCLLDAERHNVRGRPSAEPEQPPVPAC